MHFLFSFNIVAETKCRFSFDILVVVIWDCVQVLKASLVNIPKRRRNEYQNFRKMQRQNHCLFEHADKLASGQNEFWPRRYKIEASFHLQSKQERNLRFT